MIMFTLENGRNLRLLVVEHLIPDMVLGVNVLETANLDLWHV